MIYGTDKWFEGDVTVSCTDTTVTDVDMYHCSYEQFNDARIILLDTIDLNYYAYGNVPASAYLYTVVQTSPSVFDLTIVAGNAVSGHTVDRMYRSASAISASSYLVLQTACSCRLSGSAIISSQTLGLRSGLMLFYRSSHVRPM
jgi:hypothetical protein